MVHYFQKRQGDNKPLRPGNKKAHPIKSDELEYVVANISKRGSDLSVPANGRDGIGTFFPLGGKRLSRLHWAITLSLS